MRRKLTRRAQKVKPPASWVPSILRESMRITHPLVIAEPTSLGARFVAIYFGLAPRDAKTGALIVPKQLLKGFDRRDSQAPASVVLTRIGDDLVRMGITMEVTEADHLRQQARTVRLVFGAHAQVVVGRFLRGHYLDDTVYPQVGLFTGRPLYQGARLKEARAQRQRYRQETLEETDPDIRARREAYADAPPLSAWIYGNMGAAVEAAQDLKHSALTPTVRILRQVYAQPYFLPEPSPRGRTVRGFAPLQQLPGAVREALFPTCMAVDLRAAYVGIALAAGGETGAADVLKAQYARGDSPWTQMLDDLHLGGLRGEDRRTALDRLKRLTHMCYSHGVVDDLRRWARADFRFLTKGIVEHRCLEDRWLALPLPQALLRARQRIVAGLMWGDYQTPIGVIPCEPGASLDVRVGAFCRFLSVWESRFVMAAGKALTRSGRGRPIYDLHDALVAKVTHPDRPGSARKALAVMQRALARLANKAGIPARLAMAYDPAVELAPLRAQGASWGNGARIAGSGGKKVGLAIPETDLGYPAAWDYPPITPDPEEWNEHAQC